MNMCIRHSERVLRYMYQEPIIIFICEFEVRIITIFQDQMSNIYACKGILISMVCYSRYHLYKINKYLNSRLFGTCRCFV